MHPFAALVIRWLGQACFLLTTGAGAHLLIDPPGPQVGYHVAAHSLPADSVFVSHHHPDHDYVEAAQGKPEVIEPLTGPRDTESGSLSDGGEVYRYERLAAYHDNVRGAKRGPDTITVLSAGGLRVCHLGDLGQLALTPRQVQEIGRVDVLMIPVGGFFTIDGPQAAIIVGQLHPRVILPMHYGTPALNPGLRAKLAPPGAFLSAMRGKAGVVHVRYKLALLCFRLAVKIRTRSQQSRSQGKAGGIAQEVSSCKTEVPGEPVAR